MVDLSKGEQGRIKFRNGEEWFCPLVRCEGGEYFLRYEHAWYAEYTQDGKRVDGNIFRDVIEFEPGVFPELQAGCNP